MSERYDKGMGIRRNVLGDAHVDRAEAKKPAFDAPFQEIPMHVRATARTGATADDVMEALLHVAVYAGVPAANRAIAIARETFAEMERDGA